MYYTTPKNSVTGKKFQIVSDQMAAALKAQKIMADKIGFNEWRGAYFTLEGGISSCIFKKEPDMKVWKRVNGTEFMPRLNSKQGKEIAVLFNLMPTVPLDALNHCIGVKTKPFQHIGYANGKTHFGFEIPSDWKIKVPKDCKEVLSSDYNKRFPGKADNH